MDTSNGSEVEDEVLEKILRFYGNHLVSLAGLAIPKQGKPRPFFYSGFVMAIRRRWYFITAGHIIDRIASDVQEHDVQVRDCYLMDSFGSGPHRVPIPFDYGAAYKYSRYSDKDGIDFGLIEVNENTKRLLKANGIVAVLKKDWGQQEHLALDEDHFMLGLPEDSISRGIIRATGGYAVSGRPVVSAIYVQQVKQVKKEWRRRFDRFVGCIPKKEVVGDIDGMSGGPIFGFMKDGRHYIVAVQSSWLPDSGIIFGCPVPLIGQLAEKHLASLSLSSDTTC